MRPEVLDDKIMILIFIVFDVSDGLEIDRPTNGWTDPFIQLGGCIK